MRIKAPNMSDYFAPVSGAPKIAGVATKMLENVNLPDVVIPIPLTAANVAPAATDNTWGNILIIGGVGVLVYLVWQHFGKKEELKRQISILQREIEKRKEIEME